MATGYLQFENISKQFPGVKALDEITFEVAEGSVHALVGENGAGKSTLLKILSGLYRPDGGHLSLNGVAQNFLNTSEALNSGVAIIYQELNLVPEMTVAENLFLGQMPDKMGWLAKKTLRENSLALLKTLEEDIDPDCKIRSLSIAERQMIEIAKALAREARILVMDEPTAVLTARESRVLFRQIERLKAQGVAILYTSHKLEEVKAIADVVTVLRDGRHVVTAPVGELTVDDMARHMVGRDISDLFPAKNAPAGRRVHGLSGNRAGGLRGVQRRRRNHREKNDDHERGQRRGRGSGRGQGVRHHAPEHALAQIAPASVLAARHANITTAPLRCHVSDGCVTVS